MGTIRMALLHLGSENLGMRRNSLQRGGSRELAMLGSCVGLRCAEKGAAEKPPFRLAFG